MTRPLFVSLVIAACACAQLQIVAVESNAARPLHGVYQFGTVEIGDSARATLGVRNDGTAPLTLRTVTLAGAGFSLAGLPSLPLSLGPGQLATFDLIFLPLGSGTYGAFLTANSVQLMITGVAPQTVVLVFDDAGKRRIVRPGQLIDFGSVERGRNSPRRLELINRTGRRLSIGKLAAAGDGFRVTESPPLRADVEPDASLPFVLLFEPQFNGGHEGVLIIDELSYLLRGAGRDPPFPKPTIALDTASLHSAEQVQLSITLEAPSLASGAGRLRMEFLPASGLTDDPAILFLPGPGREAAFTIEESDSAARFGDSNVLAFQTGTTAGTIVFTLELGEATYRTELALPPAPAGLDSARAARTPRNIEVQLTGYDNTRTASRLAFTFFDRDGRPLAPGAIRIDAAAAFRQYFAESELGGVFSLRAIFPVAGDVAAVAAFEAEITNSAGASRTDLIRF